MRYLLNFSYDGSKYYGYQKQIGKDTIEGKIEDAFYLAFNQKVSICSTGRTDKGVHAKDQYAHFNIDLNITCNKIKKAINSFLPKDIYIKNVYEVDDKFHARYSNKLKTYSYYINIGDYDPISVNYVYQYNYHLDISKMKETLKHFIGEHDFRAFATQCNDKKNCIRNIIDAHIEVNNNIIKISFKGNGFLRYQVRNMVGILLRVGQNKITSEDVKKILLSHDRQKSGKTAPSNGLYLEKIEFLDKKVVEIIAKEENI